MDYKTINGKLEHRDIVEKVIGRKLKPEEVVHHLDLNKKNNNINNLMLFKNGSEHIRFHNYVRQFGKTNNIKKLIENRWKKIK